MQSIGHALVGDPVYGGRARAARVLGEEVLQHLKDFPRQALHAQRLELIHPASGDLMAWEADLPADMAALIKTLGGVIIDGD
jgi:23S rRNA pseudouridine1911/1915/1917 synthase